MAGVPLPGDLELIGTPDWDWMPVFQPILYLFENTSVSALTDPSITVKIEVSHNGTDFTAPITAGILKLLPNASDQYTVNPAPYLAALFTVGVPVIGIDQSLYKVYRLSADFSDLYDGTGTPTIITDPAYCLYASALSIQEDGVDTILSMEPTQGYNPEFYGILTQINAATNTITNTNEEPADSPLLPCAKYPKQLYWLNRWGGWQTWVFDGKHEYEEEVGDEVTWQDEASLTHTASIAPVLQRVAVKSGFVPKAIYDTITTIRHSILVYHKDNNAWREVNIERGSFPLFKEGDKRRECNFTFTYAEPLTIQTR